MIVAAPPVLRCPYCREVVLVEYDPVLRLYFCSVCGRMWRLTPEKVPTR